MHTNFMQVNDGQFYINKLHNTIVFMENNKNSQAQISIPCQIPPFLKFIYHKHKTVHWS